MARGSVIRKVPLLIPGVFGKRYFTPSEREQINIMISGGAASFDRPAAAPTPTPTQIPVLGVEINGTELAMVEEIPVVIEETVKPAGTQVGTRTRGGVTFAVVSQGAGLPAILIERTSFLRQREAETARELAVREAALGQQAIEQASLRKQLAVRRAELERLSRSMVVPPAFLRKKILEFEALGGKFEVGQELRETLVTGFRTGEARFERTQEKLVGIAEAKRIAGIVAEREKGIPLEEQFGLEAAEATSISRRLEAKQRGRVLSAKIVGSPGQFALEKQTLRDIQAKAGFSTEGPLGFLGITEGERAAFPIIAESLARKQRPGRARVKFLAEAGDIPGAFVGTAELIGRKGVELVVPPGIKESPGLGLLPKELTPAISAVRGVFGLKTLEAGQQFLLLGGTRDELIAKGGLAGTTLAEFAALQVAFGVVTKRIKPPKDAFKGFRLDEAAIIGKTRKKLQITRITKAESARLRKLGVIVQPTGTELKVPKITKEAAKQLKDLPKDFIPTGAAPPSGTIAIAIPKGILRKPIQIKIPVSFVAREAKAIQALRTQELIRAFARGETLKGLTRPKVIVKPPIPTKARFLPGSLAALSVGLAKPQIEIVKIKFATPEESFAESKRQAAAILPQFKEAAISKLAISVLSKQQQRVIQKEAERQRKITAIGFAQPLATKVSQTEKQRQKQLSALLVAQPQVFKEAAKELQRQRERTAVRTIFDFPAITTQRVLARAVSVPGVTFKDVAREKPTKRKQPPFKPLEFKAEKGITSKQARALVRGFAIFERRRGKFQRVGTGVFPEIAALAKAFKRAEETAAVTVKAVPTGERVKPSKAVDIKQFLKLRGRFRKGRAGAFVEKRRFRISTPGELKEITFAPRKAKAIKTKAIKSLIPSFKTGRGGLNLL